MEPSLCLYLLYPQGTLLIPEGFTDKLTRLMGLGQQECIPANPSGFSWDTKGLNEESQWSGSRQTFRRNICSVLSPQGPEVKWSDPRSFVLKSTNRNVKMSLKKITSKPHLISSNVKNTTSDTQEPVCTGVKTTWTETKEITENRNNRRCPDTGIIRHILLSNWVHQDQGDKGQNWKLQYGSRNALFKTWKF